MAMSGLKGRRGRCYRCLHSWTLRGMRRPRLCPRCKSRAYAVPKLRPVTVGRGLGIEEILHPHRAEILRAGEEHGAAMFWVFGSVRRREATSSSDVDLMVRWSRPHSLLDRIELARKIEGLVGRRVEIVNEGGLHWAIEPQVESEKAPL